MFNIQPGQGLGYSASKQIALGLGLSEIGEAIIRTLGTFTAYSARIVFIAADKATGFIANNIKTFFDTKDPE